MESIIQILHSHAATRPDSAAVMDKEGILTYGELDSRSAWVAEYILDTCAKNGVDVRALRAEGGNGARIGLLLPRSREYETALLAVIRAGCAAVPMEPDYPQGRVHTILEDSDCALCLTTAGLKDKVDNTPVLILEDVLEALSGQTADTALDLSDPQIEGIIFFTSGTTGKPKGVIHRQFVFSNVRDIFNDFYVFSEKDVILFIAGVTFIASVTDLMLPLRMGGEVYFADDTERRNPGLLYNIILEKHVTGMFASPKLYSVLRESFGRLPLEYIALGGEKAALNYPEDDNVFEVYGSSESLPVLGRRINEKDEPGSVGRPLVGVKACLLDEDGNKIEAEGVVGELCVVSPLLALGYNNLVELTEKVFTECPFEPGERMYHTGDYMAWGRDGRLIFHGRKDRMIKLRGYRVELGEIENAVQRAEGVKEAACVAVKVSGEDKLCCYYVGDTDDRKKLMSHASSLLPYYMVPDYMIRMESLPRNINDKVDYPKLAAMDIAVEDEDYKAPETETERELHMIAVELLNREDFGVTTNLMTMGFSSITVMRLITILDERLNLKVTPREVIKNPNIRALAGYIDSKKKE